MKYTVKEFYDMSDVQFRTLYEDNDFKNVLDFLETRIRLEILTIIRRFQLKGDVLFEVRKKSTSSAYSKLQTELVERQAEFGSRPVHLFELLKDLVGARIICVHEEVQKRMFEYVLQVESIAIQPDGLEFYSAPFREYTLAKDIHEDLSASIRGVKRSWSSKGDIEKKSKTSNYESLHFYVKFDSKIDAHLLRQLTVGRRSESEGERIRDRAEREYLFDLHKTFDEQQLDMIANVPIECQVRTITDHLWAQEEHKYVYKNSSLLFDTEAGTKAKEVLRGTFTGLKFAYYNVDRLRSLVRNVSASHDAVPPTYTGSSKDINPLRFAYFDEGRETLESDFRAVEGAFLEANRKLSTGEVDGRPIIDIIVELHNSVTALDPKNGSRATTVFDIESWGRRRLFYLLFAYIALSAKDKRLDAGGAQRLREDIDLVEIVGEAAFRASMYDDEGSLKLASKVYERISTFDGIARTLVGELQELDDERAMVFFDPLVGIRLASSFYLQGEFAGAFKAMRDTFEMAGASDLISWSKLELAAGFSPAEILMRYSQYLFFDSFEGEEKLLESFLALQDIFSDVFELEGVDFCSELYRCYAWYYALLNYLFTQEALIPTGLSQYKRQARNYLIKFRKEAGDSLVSEKPECLLVSIYLPIHVWDEDKRQAKIDEAYARFSDAIKTFDSYPLLAITYLKRMASQIKMRTQEKSTREYDSTFVSYSRQDLNLVDNIVNTLKQNGVKIKSDQDFEKGDVIASQVERAMIGANSAILIVTPNYLASQWAADERAFLMDKRRRKELKLVVLRCNVSDEDIAETAPLLAGILGYNVDGNDLEETLELVAKDIVKSYG